MEDDRMAKTGSTHEETSSAQKILFESVEGKDQSQDLDTDGRKMNLGK
jgi:hypothetical protein